MEFVRFASAVGPDARRRDAVDAGVSARSGNAAEGPAPPQRVRTPFHTSLLEDSRVDRRSMAMSCWQPEGSLEVA